LSRVLAPANFVLTNNPGSAANIVARVRVQRAIAETGTLVCVSGASSARGASLIPPVHIAVLEEGQILADLFDYFEQLDPQDLPANVNMITGPSKTADIEGVLVTGMHGPGAVHVVLLRP
jgi:L-lactate dehydrogenase complex protein LldG